MEDAMRDKMVKVGLAATTVALAAGVSGAFGGMALAWDGGTQIAGEIQNGGVSNECGASAELAVAVLGFAENEAPQCFAKG
jgi:hypothetical protein